MPSNVELLLRSKCCTPDRTAESDRKPESDRSAESLVLYVVARYCPLASSGVTSEAM